MSYKIFCFEAPLQLGAQEFWFFQKVDECVVLVHFVEAFPVLFQGPHIQLIVGIRKCISQGHGFCKFSICGNDFHRIPEGHKPFQAFSCQDHVHLLWQPALVKEPFDDRDQSWQQVLSFTALDIRICPLAPRFLGIEHWYFQVLAWWWPPGMKIPLESVQTAQTAFPKASSCIFFLGLLSSSNSEEFHQSRDHKVPCKKGCAESPPWHSCRRCGPIETRGGHLQALPCAQHGCVLEVLLFQADFLHSLFQCAAFPVLPITFMAWIMSIPMRKAYRAFEKNSWSPIMDHNVPLRPCGCRGWPLHSKNGDPFSKDFPSGSFKGWYPFPRASKLHFKYFQIGGQVPSDVQLFLKCCAQPMTFKWAHVAQEASKGETHKSVPVLEFHTISMEE